MKSLDEDLERWITTEKVRLGVSCPTCYLPLPVTQFVHHNIVAGRDCTCGTTVDMYEVLSVHGINKDRIDRMGLHFSAVTVDRISPD